MSSKMSREEVEHNLWVLQHHGPTVAAAGFDTTRLDGFTTLGVATAVAADPVASNRVWSHPDLDSYRDRTYPSVVDTYKLLLRVLSEMSEEELAALRQRVAQRFV